MLFRTVLPEDATGCVTATEASAALSAQATFKSGKSSIRLANWVPWLIRLSGSSPQLTDIDLAKSDPVNARYVHVFAESHQDSILATVAPVSGSLSTGALVYRYISIRRSATRSHSRSYIWILWVPEETAVTAVLLAIV